MVKGQGSNPQEKLGTPSYVILSVLLGIVVFGLEGIKDSIGVNTGDSASRMTSLAFILLGLAICFSWRRLSASPFKVLCAIVYTISIWAYFSASVALPLFNHSEEFGLQLPLIHQVGLGSLISSCILLIMAFLNNQKLAAPLLMIVMVGLAVSFASIYQLSQNSGGKNHGKFSRGSHTEAHQARISSEEDEEGTGHSEESLEPEAADEVGVGNSAINKKPSHGFKKESKMKMAAHNSASLYHEPEAEDEETLYSQSKDANENTVTTARTLSKAQKDKLSGYSKSKTKTNNAHSVMKLKAHSTASAGGDGSTSWKYSGELGPQGWGEIHPSFKSCGTGIEQSPINIPSTWGTKENIQLYYKPSTFQVLDNGYTVQVNVERGNFALIDKQRYELKQFHFHTPSEHLLNSRSAIMEVHFVHANEKGELAVIGALMVAGTLHSDLQKIWGYMPYNANELIKPIGVTINPRSLLPNELRAYNYAGSLTTPPCSENVNWNVLLASVKLSQNQINLFRNKYQMNARPAQPLNYRSKP